MKEKAVAWVEVRVEIHVANNTREKNTVHRLGLIDHPAKNM